MANSDLKRRQPPPLQPRSSHAEKRPFDPLTKVGAPQDTNPCSGRSSSAVYSIVQVPIPTVVHLSPTEISDQSTISTADPQIAPTAASFSDHPKSRLDHYRSQPPLPKPKSEKMLGYGKIGVGFTVEFSAEEGRIFDGRQYCSKIARRMVIGNDQLRELADIVKEGPKKYMGFL